MCYAMPAAEAVSTRTLPMTFRSRPLLDACRQLECAHCGIDDGTVVAAHSNSLADGKGKGIKSSDSAVASLCFTCHQMLDQGKDLSKEERREMWLAAHVRTLRQLIERGILKVAK